MFTRDSVALRSLVNPYDLVIIDEAQRITDAGIVIKILIDTFPDKIFLITGSSALELAYGMFDALTGRVFTYSMYPLSLGELSKIDRMALFAPIDSYLKYGLYPEVINAKNDREKEDTINRITMHYLFKDTLGFEMKKHTDFLEKLLALVGSQVGSLVSMNSLSNALDVSRNTVDRYLYLLKQLFIIIPLHSYHNNFKKRITAQSKFFFWDVGIRNSLIKNFGPIDIRLDKGGLWENFIIIERMKYNASRKFSCNYYFYKGKNGHEIDLVEEKDGTISCFEIKYSKDKISRGVANVVEELEIKNVGIQVINKDNFRQFIA
jgi:hypothetical protein